MSSRQDIYRAMAGLLSGQQQFVVLGWKRGGWSTFYKTGAGWDFSSGSPRLPVIQWAQTSREPVMVLDAQLDERLRDHRYSPFRSAMCIPIVKPWGLAALVLAEEAARAQGFSHRQLQVWQPLVDQLAETITAEPTQIELPMLTPRALAAIGASLLGAMILSWLLKPPPPPPKAPPTLVVPKPQEQRPEEVAAGFQSALSIGRYDMAYQLLSPDLRKKLPQKSFEGQINRWLAQPGVAQELVSRQVQVAQTRPQKVVLALTSNRRGSQPWQWVMVETGEGWRLDRLPGK